jgi:hypothetical protein
MVGVVTLIPEHVTAAAACTQQSLCHLRLGDVHPYHFPSYGQRTTIVDRVQLVSPGEAADGVSQGRLRILGVAANDQRLAIDDPHPAPRLRMQQLPFHGSQQAMHFGGSHTPAHRRLRGQAPQSFTEFLRPVSWIAGPRHRSIVKHRPEVDGHDRRIEKRCRPGTSETLHSPAPTDTVTSRVRVPCWSPLNKRGYTTSAWARTRLLYQPCANSPDA